MQNSAEMGGLEDKRSDGTRRVAAVPGLAILPTDGEEIRTAAEKSSEQGNFVFDCRIPIDEMAGFFRRKTLIAAVCSLGADCRVSTSAMIAARYSAVCRLAKPSRADFDSMPLHTAVDQLDRLHNGIPKSERWPLFRI